MGCRARLVGVKKNYFCFDELDTAIFDKDQELPAKFAVIGCPIEHSKSPQMQQAALNAAKQASRYIRVESKPEQLNDTIFRLKELGFIGVNITVPHKPAARLICTRVDALAEATGSVNTLSFMSNGEIFGYNTDGPGFIRAIRECFAVDLKDLKIVLLGATGGAGTALAYTCAMARCERLTLIDLPGPRLSELKSRLKSNFIDERRLEGSADRLQAFEFGSQGLLEALVDADLIVNATALGLRPSDPSPIPSSSLQAYHLVYDLQTHVDALQADADAQGARSANGLSMLLHQGALSFEKWLGIAPDISKMRQALNHSA